MVRGSVRQRLDRVRRELHRAFAEEHSTREVAGSFSLGVFITMLPTLGTGLLVFLVIAWLTDRVSKIALFASVLVFNPVVKWGVYAASFTLGVVILGPVEGVTPAEVSFSAGPEIVTRLLVGNLILAVVAAVPSYFVCYRLVEAYNAREIDIVGLAEEVESVAEADPDEVETVAEAEPDEIASDA